MKNISWPKVSIVIPTLNAEGVIAPCFESIRMQDYPKDKIEIILADGGSTDDTEKLAKKYGAEIVFNKLKTAEAGKAVGVREATGDYIALIDSDNILPTKDWLKQMISPLIEEGDVVGSEPWEYTWREEDSFITRYCALIGMNDPFVAFVGNYDRKNLLTGKWTEVEHEEEDKGDYLLNTFDERGLPTIGANGVVFRSNFLKNNLKGDYLFDIDILASYIKKEGNVRFIKTKNGIIHTFCEANPSKFAKKQRRRVKDFLFHQSINNREFDWALERSNLLLNKAVGKFVLYNILIIPPFVDAIRGYIKKQDSAWLFHPLANYITLWEYGFGVISSFFSNKELDRSNWKQ